MPPHTAYDDPLKRFVKSKPVPNGITGTNLSGMLHPLNECNVS